MVYRNSLIINFDLAYAQPPANYSAPSQNAVVETIYPYGNPNNTTGYSPNGTDEVSWDNGQVGNYWSDYFTKYPNATELDSSGIGNTPYVIDSNNIDNYPLTSASKISLVSSSPTLTPPTSPTQQPIAEPNSTPNVPQDDLTLTAVIVGTVMAVVVVIGLLVYLAKKPRKTKLESVTRT